MVWVKVGILYADHVTVYFISQLKMNRNATEFSLLSYCNPVLWHNNIIYCFSFGKKCGIINTLSMIDLPLILLKSIAV